MANQEIRDLIAQNVTDIEGKYLAVQSDYDGLNEVTEGYHYYKVDKDQGYTVYPVHYDVEKKDFVQADSPVVYTDGETLYYVSNTHYDIVEGVALNKKPISESESEEQAVLKGFQVFAHDEYQWGTYTIFMKNEPFLKDSLSDAEATTTSTTTSTVAPETTTSTTTSTTTTTKAPVTTTSTSTTTAPAEG